MRLGLLVLAFAAGPALARPGDVGEPLAIPGAPFVHAASTTGRDAQIARYACDPTPSEAGPEVVYRFVTTTAGTLTAWVEGDGSGVDVDVHILGALTIDGSGTASDCVDRDDEIASGRVAAGTHHVVVDSYRDAAHAGAYRLRVDFQPDDDWYVRDLARGVRLKTKPYSSLFGARENGSVLEVDLGAPGVMVKPISTGRCATTSSLGRGAGAVAAINGGFFGSACASLSLLKIDGALIATNARNRSAFGIDAMGRPMIAQIATGQDWPAAVQALGGVPRVVSGGQIDVRTIEEESTLSFETARHPRTAVGITSAGDLLLATADGRTAAGAGMSLPELAQWMIWLGASEAVNFDGGGSTALWAIGEPFGGVVNYPSDNGLADHAGERAVSNALGVFAEKIDRPVLWLSEPPLEAREGMEWRFEVVAADPEGEAIQIGVQADLRVSDRGDGTASIAWTPAQVSPRTIEVYARVRGSATSTLSFEVVVHGDVVPLDAGVLAEDATADAGAATLDATDVMVPADAMDPADAALPSAMDVASPDAAHADAADSGCRCVQPGGASPIALLIFGLIRRRHLGFLTIRRKE